MSRKRRHKKHRDETEAVTVKVTAPADQPSEEDIQPADGTSSHASEHPLEAANEPGPDDELERLAVEARDMRALAQRKQAEFENYRRRIERERAETAKYAAADVVKEILPVLDNLERAVEAAKASPSGGQSQLREGVEIICKQFRDTLDKLGMTEVDAEDAPFDPHVHEAVGRVETDEHPEGTVVTVLQKGYFFKDRLLRPAMVSVSLPKSAEASREDHANEDKTVRQGE